VYAEGNWQGGWWNLLTASFNESRWLPAVALKMGKQKFLRQLAVAISNS
jgi:hypothetical protein